MDSYLLLLSEAEAVLLAGVSAVLLGFLLLALSPRWRVRNGKRWAGVVFALLLGGVGAGLVCGQKGLAAAFGVLAGLWALGGLLRLSGSVNLFRRVGLALGQHHVQAVVLILLGFATLLGWDRWQDSRVNDLSDTEIEAAGDKPPPMKPLDTPALTDRGNPVLLRVLIDPNQADFSAEAEKKFITNTGLLLRTIRTAPPSMESNCHGWVFTAGRHWILGEDVQRILDDNGYEVVTAPRVGDLIVYRDAVSQKALHTGVVSTVTPDGKVLVESKWGKMGCYLHLPEDQSYSMSWQFYRSPRKGHLLKNLPAQPPPANVPAPGKLVG